ncbi:MAG: sigma-54-dependent Fis family transcriptional regulator [Alphaproteobacteria bacterium]|nr:MAG: sigma-54-dependent Fis family transcriptional regulator [Alphaproteobacteria bacterium]
MPDRILIVDDDPVQRRLLHGQVSRMGYETAIASGGVEALDMLSGPARRFAAVVLDLVMPDLDGLGVLAAMRGRAIVVPVIVQTARGGIDTVVGAMRAGAFDFVVKPVSPERLQVSLANALKVGALTDEVARFTRVAEGRLTFRDIICASPGMERVIRIAEKAARSQIPVLIEGESGVGKELIARAIQGSSTRRAKPFVTVNCGALPENLVESILFGHEKGAFTGATDRHVGKFEEANGGTLFLDEVGELPPDIQVKLLRAIQEGEIDPVGARRPVRVDIRLISATNKNLIAEVEAGRFREDLYYRLNVLAVTVPPLRERRAEIPLLVRHFMQRFAAMENRPQLRAVTAEAEALLCAHDWPGNIRQLENAVFRAVVLAEGDVLTVDEFPQIAAQVAGLRRPPATLAVDAPPLQSAPEETWRPEPHLAPAAPPDQLTLLSGGGHVRPLDEIEAAAIRFAIDHYNGRMAEVARRLGIGRSTLYRKLRDYGLDEAGPASAGDAH